MELLYKGIIDYLKEYRDSHPDSIALFNEEYGYTVNELYEQTTAAASFLAEHGVRCGENVGLCGLRTPETVIFFLAIQYIGAVAVLCDPHSPVSDFISEAGDDIAVSHIIDNDDGCWYIDGIAYGKGKFLGTEGSAISKPDLKAPAVIIFTSGSTGQRKGVIHSQFSYINHQQNFYTVSGCEGNDRGLFLLPLFHIYGLTQAVDGIMHQYSNFFPREVTPDYICKCIEKYRLTRVALVPSLALAMSQVIIQKGYDVSSLRQACVAGAYTSREQFNYIQETLGVKLVPVYGMSECAGISGADASESDDDRAGSVGKILPLTQVRIGEDGEIMIKGPTVFYGYVGEEPIDRDEFFDTGDLGFIDDKGFLHITGRKKEIVIRNGQNISISYLENTLRSLDFVQDAAVVGIEDEKCGEVPAAVIMLKAGAAYNEDAVTALFNKLERPERIRIVDKIPLKPTGKADKQKIKEMFI